MCDESLIKKETKERDKEKIKFGNEKTTRKRAWKCSRLLEYVKFSAVVCSAQDYLNK